jgi:superfamily II DNA or RNA helicase
MDTLFLEDVDSVFIRVRCERGIAKELSDCFSFEVPGHKWINRYRKSRWNGRIHLYNIGKGTIYRGLRKYLSKFAADRGYRIESSLTPETKFPLAPEEVDALFDRCVGKASGIPSLHDHQRDAVVKATNAGRVLLVSPTGSGKSLIIYLLLRHLLEHVEGKALIVVPTIGLVTQMASDFEKYAEGTGWKVGKNCHSIYAGQEKETNKRVVITTWQSIFKEPRSYFEQFDIVFGDECHMFKAKSLSGIMEKMVKCQHRIGTTGTLDGMQCHKLIIEGLFGPSYHVTSTKKLIEENILSRLRIDTILLQYPDEERRLMSKHTYSDEMLWLIANPKRNRFIVDLSKRLKGNTLVLFQYVEKHGKVLHDMLSKDGDRKVFFVHGGTEAEDRENVRTILEQNDSCIVVASYGTFSTGISIKRLHNIVFASPTKSRIRVLQSIGRQLRVSEHKELARLYDIGDDLSWKSRKNHTLRHFAERMKIYRSEKFDFRPVLIRTENLP